MAHRKWKQNQQEPSLLPGPAVPGCSLVSFHFLWAILCSQAVEAVKLTKTYSGRESRVTYFRAVTLKVAKEI